MQWRSVVADDVRGAAPSCGGCCSRAACKWSSTSAPPSAVSGAPSEMAANAPQRRRARELSRVHFGNRARSFVLVRFALFPR